ncbi:uncharacterized protein LOC134540325 [Bacillus rossius redtenbacheri]|uniref:uncharacterized protein LOC134540325 n=1 Tax=Bacillus rossius redtenbacheri TaxID=93214 RepID=UPI002FDD029C
MKRHKEIISERFCQNIKRARASISTSTVNEYFDNLAESIRDVPGSHIVNFDETNLTNDPGTTKIITKRGCKYPERVVNQSKSAVSIMFAASASGELLPCYVVYKSKHLYTTWTEGAPKGTRFNCTQSGWFDGFTFEDWVKNVALPYFKDKEGKKILIGDNLSSHLSCEAIRVCQENDIHFVFLPSNSTHLTQPLDVAFFRPLKVAWRKVLLKWKLGPGMREPSLPKDVFPRLLTKLLQQIELNAVENIKSGFEKSGIMPLNRKKVLDMLPSTEDKEGVEKAMQDSFKTLLYNMRYGDSGTGTQPKRSRKKIPVEAGKSVQCPIPVSDEDYEPEVPEEAYSENTQDVAFPEKRNNTADDSSDDSFSDGSIDSQELEESKVTKFGRTFNNIEPVSEDDIHVKDWVLVGFAAETGSKPGPSRLLYYIGQVVQKLDCETFEASFLRFKQTRDFSGHIYVFPAVLDFSSFTFSQVVGKLSEPEVIRRGQLKFKFNQNSIS